MRTFMHGAALLVILGGAAYAASESSGSAGPLDTALIAALTGVKDAFDEAVVDRDFAVLESELQGVLKALRGHGIDIAASHQHMTGEEPRIMFLHDWSRGSVEALAKAIRAALDATRTM